MSADLRRLAGWILVLVASLGWGLDLAQPIRAQDWQLAPLPPAWRHVVDTGLMPQGVWLHDASGTLILAHPGAGTADSGLPSGAGLALVPADGEGTGILGATRGWTVAQLCPLPDLNDASRLLVAGCQEDRVAVWLVTASPAGPGWQAEPVLEMPLPRAGAGGGAGIRLSVLELAAGQVAFCLALPGSWTLGLTGPAGSAVLTREESGFGQTVEPVFVDLEESVRGRGFTLASCAAATCELAVWEQAPAGGLLPWTAQWCQTGRQVINDRLIGLLEPAGAGRGLLFASGCQTDSRGALASLAAIPAGLVEQLAGLVPAGAAPCRVRLLAGGGGAAGLLVSGREQWYLQSAGQLLALPALAGSNGGVTGLEPAAGAWLGLLATTTSGFLVVDWRNLRLLDCRPGLGGADASIGDCSGPLGLAIRAWQENGRAAEGAGPGIEGGLPVPAPSALETLALRFARLSGRCSSLGLDSSPAQDRPGLPAVFINRSFILECLP